MPQPCSDTKVHTQQCSRYLMSPMCPVWPARMAGCPHKAVILGPNIFNPDVTNTGQRSYIYLMGLAAASPGEQTAEVHFKWERNCKTVIKKS